MSNGLLKFSHCAPSYPVRHRRKVPFLPDVIAPAELSRRLLEIRDLDQELDRFILTGRDYLDLLAEAVSTEIHTSVKLEGNPLPLREVRNLTLDSMAGEGRPIRNRFRREIQNHVPSWLHPERWNTPWSIDTLLRLHGVLFEGVAVDGTPGMFSQARVAVVSDKNQETFLGAPADQIGVELGSLVEWVNTRSEGLSPVVAAAVLFHEFESIHGFEDGNGRTGRTLFHIYLQNHGLPNSRYCKMEQKLIHDPELYYRILGWTDQRGSYTELVDFFTDAILESYREAVEQFRGRDLLTRGLDETSRRLLVQAKRSGTWFSIREAARWTDGVTEQTVRIHLNDLVDMGALEARGETRSRRYHYDDPLDPTRTGGPRTT